MQPLFIFSLPRSGSTLLQRILAESGQIATATEPWVLLPYVYSLKARGVISEYWHGDATEAIEDFYNGFPHKRNDYENELRQFILNLYQINVAKGERYFLDKTPRYSLIADEIIRLFPDAKFIFLWRNPLSIVSSMVTRWCKGKWKIRMYRIDLFKGLNVLINAFVKNNRKTIALNYENLVENPEEEVKKICEYLEIDFEERMINSFYNKSLNGRMAEKSGSKNYGNRISKKSLNPWKNVLVSSYRRRWARKYIRWIGEERLKVMGYDYSELIAGIREKKGVINSAIVFDMAYDLLTKGVIVLSVFKAHFENRFLFR